MGSGSCGHLKVVIVVFGVDVVKICYIDEAGDLGMLPQEPKLRGNNQPVLVIGGLFIDNECLYDLTHDFLHLKQRYFPNLCSNHSKYLDRILPEIKGSDVRKAALRGVRRQRRHAFGFMDRVIEIFEQYSVEIVSRIWVKIPGKEFHGNAVYSSSIQSIYEYFNHYLLEKQDVGFCIADSRDQLKNIMVSHSVFTQKFRILDPAYPQVSELPLFGHSNNHAGLQLCDILCSSFLFPIASYVYCHTFVNNVHVDEGALTLRERYGVKLKHLQHRYQDFQDFYSGGIIVSDPVGKYNSAHMFR